MSSAADSSLLRCTALEAGYATGQPVLFGVDLTVDRGEIVALLGTNGAGKSTLLKAISQLVRPTAGSIMFEGSDVTKIGPLAATRRGIVQIPGRDAVFPTLSVAEHFRAASSLCPDPTALERRTADALDLFPRLRAHWKHRGGDLSGGEQRQLALATALLGDPRLLLIDEMALGLAAAVVDELVEVIRGISAGGCATLVVDQSVAVAVRLAHRAYFMEEGTIRFHGTPEELLDRPALLRPIFLSDPASAPRRRRAVEPPADPGAGAPALAVRGLTKYFGGITAVEHVTMEVAPGAIVGLVGPNGAGKTTLVDLVSGLLRPDDGAIQLGPIDITALSAHRRARLGLGRSFQDAHLFSTLTTAENVAVAFESHLEVRDHLASTLALPAARAMEADVARHVGGLIELLGLDHWRDIPVAELSTGTRRVVELAMELAHQPRVLLLDEPSAGLAHAEAEALRPLLLRVRHETGCSMLLVEHDLELVRSVADEVIVMDSGRVVATGTPDDVLGHGPIARSRSSSRRQRTRRARS